MATSRDEIKRKEFESLVKGEMRSISRSRSRSRLNDDNCNNPPKKRIKLQKETSIINSNINSINFDKKMEEEYNNLDKYKDNSPSPLPTNIKYGVDPQTLRKFCQPYSLNELVKLLARTATKNTSFYNVFLNKLNHETKWCKLFVFNIHYNTKQEILLQRFSQFGDIKECVILKNKNGESKGYGFIKLKINI